MIFPLAHPRIDAQAGGARVSHRHRYGEWSDTNRPRRPSRSRMRGPCQHSADSGVERQLPRSNMHSERQGMPEPTTSVLAAANPMRDWLAPFDLEPSQPTSAPSYNDSRTRHVGDASQAYQQLGRLSSPSGRTRYGSTVRTCRSCIPHGSTVVQVLAPVHLQRRGVVRRLDIRTSLVISTVRG